MKKKLINIIASGIITLSSAAIAEYPSQEFTTYGKDHLDEAKEILKERGEKFKFFQPESERKDYDGDNIKDISIKTNKDNIYHISSKDLKEGKINPEKWIWYKADN